MLATNKSIYQTDITHLTNAILLGPLNLEFVKDLPFGTTSIIHDAKLFGFDYTKKPKQDHKEIVSLLIQSGLDLKEDAFTNNDYPDWFIASKKGTLEEMIGYYLFYGDF